MGPAQSHVEICPGRMAVLRPEGTAGVVCVNQCPEVKRDLPAPPGLQGRAPDLQLPLNNAVSSVVLSDLMYRVLGTLTVPPRPLITAFPPPASWLPWACPSFHAHSVAPRSPLAVGAPPPSLPSPRSSSPRGWDHVSTVAECESVRATWSPGYSVI